MKFSFLNIFPIHQFAISLHNYYFMKNENRRDFIIINTFIFLLLLAALGVVLYLLFLNWQNKKYQEAYQSIDNPVIEKGADIYYTDPNSISESETDTKNTEQIDTTTLNFLANIASFKFDYPSNWSVEENSEADFAVVRNESNQNAITIRVVKKSTNLLELPFDQYVTQAAKNEIQGFQSLENITQFTTKSGTIGYNTTWKIQFLGGEEFVSNPLVYFPHPFDPDKSIQISLENADYLEQFNNLVTSMNFN